MIELDTFTQGYIDCALWAESAGIDIADDGTVTENPESDTSFERHNFDAGDIAPESLARIVAECAQFQEANARLLAIADRLRPNFADDAQHGYDFWLTRNGHGAGFWDRGYRFGIGDALTQAASDYGSSYMYYVNGKIYVS
jgi:hypothetical protein